MRIRHLSHNKIDRSRWDSTISAALNTLPYAFSWYLDAVCPDWEALASDDYHYLMPLPAKKKYGIKYLINPRWTQQLGVFSDKPLTSDILHRFVRKIPYLFYDFNLNYSNIFDGITTPSKVNYIIDTKGGMQVVRRRYDVNTRRAIEKAHASGLTIDDELDVEDFVRLWQQENRDKDDELHRKLPKLAFSAEGKKTGVFLGIYSEDDLLAAVFAVRHTDRLIFLAPVSTARAKECCAMFLAVDYLIKEWCCRYGLLFDCEGSMLPGVARFYRGFGPTNQPYCRIRRGRPDWLVNLIHRQKNKS